MESIKTLYTMLISSTATYRATKGYGPRAVKKKLKIAGTLIDRQRYQHASILMDQVRNIVETVPENFEKPRIDISKTWASHIGMWTQLMKLTEPLSLNGKGDPIKCIYCKADTGYLFVSSCPDMYGIAGNDPNDIVVSCAQHSFKAHITWVHMAVRNSRAVARDYDRRVRLDLLERKINNLRTAVRQKTTKQINWPKVPKATQLVYRMEERA